KLISFLNLIYQKIIKSIKISIINKIPIICVEQSETQQTLVMRN
ncbi:MAG: hypothetical protein RLZZ176_2951, partial [Cyanobacteriota bacterium]